MKFDWKALDLMVIDWIVIALAFIVALALVEAFFYRSGLSFRAVGSIFAVAVLTVLLFLREKISTTRLFPRSAVVKK